MNPKPFFLLRITTLGKCGMGQQDIMKVNISKKINTEQFI